MRDVVRDAASVCRGPRLLGVGGEDIVPDAVVVHDGVVDDGVLDGVG